MYDLQHQASFSIGYIPQWLGLSVHENLSNRSESNQSVVYLLLSLYVINNVLKLHNVIGGNFKQM